jgi:hypothetical protein
VAVPVGAAVAEAVAEGVADGVMEPVGLGTAVGLALADEALGVGVGRWSGLGCCAWPGRWSGCLAQGRAGWAAGPGHVWAPAAGT